MSIMEPQALPADPKKGRLAVRTYANRDENELVSVATIKYKDRIWRHDTWPFLVLYAGIILLAGSYASTFKWCANAALVK